MFNVLFLTSLVIVIRFFWGHVFILLGRLLRSDLLGIEHGSTFLILTSLIIVIRFCWGYVFTLLGRLLRFLETMEMWFDLTDQMTVMGVTWAKEHHTLSSFPSEQTRISSLERHLRKLADSVGKFCCCNPPLVALKVTFCFSHHSSSSSGSFRPGTHSLRQAL